MGESVQVDVYYSGNRNTKRFLIVPAETDVSSLTFPVDDPDLNHRDLNGLKPFALDVGAYLFGATPDDVQNQIQAKGYAVCGLPGEVDQTAH